MPKQKIKRSLDLIFKHPFANRQSSSFYVIEFKRTHPFANSEKRKHPLAKRTISDIPRS
jgi:hypothetical protein